MLIKVKRDWELPEAAATPESAYLGRREWLKQAGFAGLIAAASPLGLAAAADAPADPSAKLYPAKHNDQYTIDSSLVTKEAYVTTYNNFYEYSTDKNLWEEAQKLPVRPWTVSFEGMVEKPFTVDIDTLLKAMPLEERTYRHRCVEAWSMVVPWTGFPLKKLVEYAKPLSGASYLEVQTFSKKEVPAPGFRQSYWPWPYTEGVTMAEAMNDLAFVSTGLYGSPARGQNGAPIRLTLPWKYGFKSAKSLIAFRFTDKRPKTFWEATNASEYGFWANVNPEVAHPRWSQAFERVLGANAMLPTKVFNGYGEQVAGLYSSLKGEKLFM